MPGQLKGICAYIQIHLSLARVLPALAPGYLAVPMIIVGYRPGARKGGRQKEAFGRARSSFWTCVLALLVARFPPGVQRTCGYKGRVRVPWIKSKTFRSVLVYPGGDDKRTRNLPAPSDTSGQKKEPKTACCSCRSNATKAFIGPALKLFTRLGPEQNLVSI